MMRYEVLIVPSDQLTADFDSVSGTVHLNVMMDPMPDVDAQVQNIRLALKEHGFSKPEVNQVASEIINSIHMMATLKVIKAHIEK